MSMPAVRTIEKIGADTQCRCTTDGKVREQPAVCACLASVDAAKRVEKRAGCRLKLTRRGWRPCCCPPMDRASPYQSAPRLAYCQKLAPLPPDAACADEIQRRV